MDNKIKPHYVDFNTAKLLKEKGFDVEVTNYYFEDGEFREFVLTDTVGMDYGSDVEYELCEFYFDWNRKDLFSKKNGQRLYGFRKNKDYFETFSAPEQSQVIEWLRVRFNIDLQTICNYSKLGRTYRMGIIFINKFKKIDSLFLRPINEISQFTEFNSPQEAYSAAFDYVLNKLI
jgi:hypothetical protein